MTRVIVTGGIGGAAGAKQRRRGASVVGLDLRGADVERDVRVGAWRVIAAALPALRAARGRRRGTRALARAALGGPVRDRCAGSRAAGTSRTPGSPANTLRIR